MITPNKLQLEKLRFTIKQELSELSLQDLSVDAWQSDLKDYMVFEVKGSIMAEKLLDDTVRYPRNWWQHFKEEVMPKWFTDRYPVECTVYSIKRYAKYPRLPMVFEGHKAVIEDMIQEKAQ